MPYAVVATPFRDNWYFDGVSEAVRARLGESGVDIRTFVQPVGVTASMAVTDRFDETFADADCVGAVSIGFEFANADIRRLKQRARPVVTIGGSCPGIPSVSIDDEQVAHAATDHLLALGHRSIAHLAGYALSPDGFSMRSDRVRGYSAAMLAAGVDHLSQVVPCEFTAEAAYRASREILTEADRPTAIFAVTDELAFAALAAAADLGLRVPHDLSVLGIDDHPDSIAHGLTTFRQDLKSMGRAAADRISGTPEPAELVVDVDLVERTSTASPGANAPTTHRGFLDRFRRH